MYISQESSEQTQARLLKVIARAEFVFFEGIFAFEEFPLSDFPHHATPEVLAFVRDDKVWSQLIPSRDATKELFSIFCFHFADGLDNSGFVGWLATHLKQTLGTGVFVVCGQNSHRGGIFDYWGCPAQLGSQVKGAIENLMSQRKGS